MSSGNELQEMEVGTKQSKTAVNANARTSPYQKMEKHYRLISHWSTSVEDLGGPHQITTNQITIQQN